MRRRKRKKKLFSQKISTSYSRPPHRLKTILFALLPTKERHPKKKKKPTLTSARSARELISPIPFPKSLEHVPILFLLFLSPPPPTLLSFSSCRLFRLSAFSLFPQPKGFPSFFPLTILSPPSPSPSGFSLTAKREGKAPPKRRATLMGWRRRRG